MVKGFDVVMGNSLFEVFLFIINLKVVVFILFKGMDVYNVISIFFWVLLS